MNRRRFLSNSVFSALFGTVASSIPAKGLAAFAKPAMLDVSPLTVGGFMYRGDNGISGFFGSMCELGKLLVGVDVFDGGHD
jgi:hypothetical protein